MLTKINRKIPMPTRPRNALSTATRTILACFVVCLLIGCSPANDNSVDHYLNREREEFAQLHEKLILTQAILEQLEDNRIQDAKQMLQLQQDGAILAIDSLLSEETLAQEDLEAPMHLLAMTYPDRTAMEISAHRLLARIGQHREAHPLTHTSQLPALSAEARQAVTDLLEWAVHSPLE